MHLFAKQPFVQVDIKALDEVHLHLFLSFKRSMYPDTTIQTKQDKQALITSTTCLCGWNTTGLVAVCLCATAGVRMACYKPTTAMMLMMALLLGTAIALANANGEPATFKTRKGGSYKGGILWWRLWWRQRRRLEPPSHPGPSSTPKASPRHQLMTISWQGRPPSTCKSLPARTLRFDCGHVHCWHALLMGQTDMSTLLS